VDSLNWNSLKTHPHALFFHVVGTVWYKLLAFLLYLRASDIGLVFSVLWQLQLVL
jgi:hypothetical protein